MAKSGTSTWIYVFITLLVFIILSCSSSIAGLAYYAFFRRKPININTCPEQELDYSQPDDNSDNGAEDDASNQSQPSQQIPAQPSQPIQPVPQPAQQIPTQPAQQIPTQQCPIQQCPIQQPYANSNMPLRKPKPPIGIGPGQNRRQRQSYQGQSQQPYQPPQAPQTTIPNQNMPTTPAAPATSSVWVTEHNRIRADVGQRPVVWNDTLAQGALEYSAKCIFQHSDQNSRTYNGNILGENLAYGSPYDYYDDKAIVKMWEDEKAIYKYPQTPGEGSHEQGKQIGHYTQIVNKNVTEIGCGCTNCNGSKMCVCRYNPIQLGNEPPY